MSTVGLTPNIKSRIIDSILKPLKDELACHHATLPEITNKLAVKVQDLLFPDLSGSENKRAYNVALSLGWLLKGDVSITWTYKRAVVITLYGQLVIPASKISSRYFGGGISENVKFETENDIWPELREFLVQSNQLLTEIAELETKTKDMLEKFTTLNQLEKVWPSVVEFVDEHTVSRLKEKKPRAAKRVLPDEIPDDVFVGIAQSRLLKSP